MKRWLFTLLAVVSLVLTPGPNSGQVLRSSPVEGTWQFSGFLELMQLESFRNGLLAGMIGLPNGPQFDLTGDLDGEAIELEVAIPDQKRAITFKGTIKGDRMTLTRAVVIHDGGARGDDGIFGAGGPSKVTATRVEATPRAAR